MKTIRQWLETLPPYYRDRALRNTDADTLLYETTSLEGAVQVAFLWRETEEGHSFWYNVSRGRLPNKPSRASSILRRVKEALGYKTN